jgi:hypothetical protein
MVRGDHPDQVAYHRYVLGQLRAARLRAKLLVLEITTIGVALRDGWLGPDDAIEELARAQALDFLQPDEPPWERPDDSATVPVDAEINRTTAGGRLADRAGSPDPSVEGRAWPALTSNGGEDGRQLPDDRRGGEPSGGSPEG